MPERKELFRVVVRSATRAILSTETPTEFYTEAHLSSSYYDDEFPQKVASVQRSLDDGKTWDDYEASEDIAGQPAWAHHLEIWQTAQGVG